jgi:hypothetical protein
MDAFETQARLPFLAMLERSPNEWSKFLEASAGDMAVRGLAEVL